MNEAHFQVCVLCNNYVLHNVMLAVIWLKHNEKCCIDQSDGANWNAYWLITWGPGIVTSYHIRTAGVRALLSAYFLMYVCKACHGMVPPLYEIQELPTEFWDTMILSMTTTPQNMLLPSEVKDLGYFNVYCTTATGCQLTPTAVNRYININVNILKLKL